jgi:ribonuclease P protein subunit RPR2
MNKKSKDIASLRTRALFQLARKNIHKNPHLAQRYVDIAKRISMRMRIHLSREQRFFVCKHCKSFIFPGVTSRVRIRSKREPHRVVTCMYCGKFMRMPLKKK